MAMQLAMHRWKGGAVATYEPAHTRRFLWGRTACIRTASVASTEWTAAMAAAAPALPPSSAAECRALLALLRRACTVHSESSAAAGAGLDADRHLLGLKLLWADAAAASAADAGSKSGSSSSGSAHPVDAAAAFFSDPLFSRSKTWLLSTSNLTLDCVENWGWGEVTPGGLGVAYSTREDALSFNIVGEATTGVEAFAEALRAALRDMAALAEAAEDTGCAAAAAAATPRL